MNFPDDETGQVLAEMFEAGVDLSKSYSIVFFQLFEQKADAQQMVDHLAAQAPEIQVELSADDLPNIWDVNCMVEMLPSYDGIVAQEAEFAQLAAKFNGYNDGWGIEV